MKKINVLIFITIALLGSYLVYSNFALSMQVKELSRIISKDTINNDESPFDDAKNELILILESIEEKVDSNNSEMKVLEAVFEDSTMNIEKKNNAVQKFYDILKETISTPSEGESGIVLSDKLYISGMDAAEFGGPEVALYSLERYRKHLIILYDIKDLSRRNDQTKLSAKINDVSIEAISVGESVWYDSLLAMTYSGMYSQGKLDYINNLDAYENNQISSDELELSYQNFVQIKTTIIEAAKSINFID